MSYAYSLLIRTSFNDGLRQRDERNRQYRALERIALYSDGVEIGPKFRCRRLVRRPGKASIEVGQKRHRRPGPHRATKPQIPAQRTESVTRISLVWRVAAGLGVI